ncbi:MAG: XdhC family protein [Aeropyrum sp.]|nr:XdhC family protein [Aeropyrum sp.]
MPEVKYDENLAEWVDLVRNLIEEEREFVIAVVVSVKGSAAAKVGAKGAILPDGRVLGWLGGWCSENAILLAALETLKTGRPRIIKLVMAGKELRQVSEDVIEVGTPCGGEVMLYVEPVYPKPQVIAFGHNRVVRALVDIMKILGFKTVVVDPAASREAYPSADSIVTSLEDLDKLRWDRHTYSVLASMGRTDIDLEVLQKILRREQAAVFLVSSVRRADEIIRTLIRRGFGDEINKIQTPAGIDLAAVTPEELALSIAAGIVAKRRGGTGRFLNEVKGDPVKKAVTTLER